MRAKLRKWTYPEVMRWLPSMELMNLAISECHRVIVCVLQEDDAARDEAQRASLANSQPRRVVESA
jgi:hypothetical protein